jgi:hypothetical protein
VLGAAGEEMGKKQPLDQHIPNFLLPGQKAPPCDARFGEVAINGGCWVNTGDVKPPCGLLFRSGDKCYAPKAVDPQKPSTFIPEVLDDQSR